jgi:hypothetical protein
MNRREPVASYRLSMKQITSNPPFIHTRPQYTFDEFFTFLIITEKMEFDYIYVIGQKKSSNKSKQILLKGSSFCQTTNSGSRFERRRTDSKSA